MQHISAVHSAVQLQPCITLCLQQIAASSFRNGNLSAATIKNATQTHMRFFLWMCTIVAAFGHTLDDTLRSTCILMTVQQCGRNDYSF